MDSLPIAGTFHGNAPGVPLVNRLRSRAAWADLISAPGKRARFGFQNSIITKQAQNIGRSQRDSQALPRLFCRPSAAGTGRRMAF